MKCAALCLLALSLVCAAGEKPNVILIMTDDQGYGDLSCHGNPVLKTPNLDRLAAEGTKFNNAFLTTSICCVSRASILTGQYARRHQVNDFGTHLKSLKNTYPGVLRQAG